MSTETLQQPATDVKEGRGNKATMRSLTTLGLLLTGKFCLDIDLVLGASAEKKTLSFYYLNSQLFCKLYYL